MPSKTRRPSGHPTKVQTRAVALIGPDSKPKFEVVTKAIAAKELGLSPRRLLEVAAARGIRRVRHKERDSRHWSMYFSAVDVAREKNRDKSKVIKGLTGPPTLDASGSSVAVNASMSLIANLITHLQSAELGVLPLFLTLDQAARYSGLPASTLKSLIDSGELPARNVGVRKGGQWRISKKALEAIGETVQKPTHNTERPLQIEAN